jgi:hypothetical protein
MSQWGFDHRYNRAEVDLKLRQGFSEGGVANPFSTGALKQVTVTGKANYLGVYWRNEFTPSENSPWTFLPSLRAEYYSTTRQLLPLPRAGIRYRWDDGLSFRLSAGAYAQPPREQDTDPTTGNPDVKAPRAYHLAFSVERDLRQGSSRGWVLTPGVFYKYLERLVVGSTNTVTRNGETVSENVTNAGRGRAYGFELLARLDAAPWTGWLSYTLSRSTRASPGQAESVYGFDQTHVLTAIASRELPGNWRIGARLRFATGNPYTPVTGGVLDADNDVYVPLRGETYSERLPNFFQLDLRVDKKWVYDTWLLSAYLDIQNATNRQNLERNQYAYDYSSSERVAGLPIIPSIGLRAEF